LFIKLLVMFKSTPTIIKVFLSKQESGLADSDLVTFFQSCPLDYFSIVDNNPMFAGNIFSIVLICILIVPYS
jgi:hypothetical protein